MGNSASQQRLPTFSRSLVPPPFWLLHVESRNDHLPGQSKQEVCQRQSCANASEGPVSQPPQGSRVLLSWDLCPGRREMWKEASLRKKGTRLRNQWMESSEIRDQIRKVSLLIHWLITASVSRILWLQRSWLSGKRKVRKEEWGGVAKLSPLNAYTCICEFIPWVLYLFGYFWGPYPVLGGLGKSICSD